MVPEDATFWDAAVFFVFPATRVDASVAKSWATRRQKKNSGADSERPQAQAAEAAGAGAHWTLRRLRREGENVLASARVLLSAAAARSAAAGVARHLLSPIALTALALRAALAALAWAGFGLESSILFLALHHASTWVGLFLTQSFYFDVQAALSGKLLGCPTLSGIIT